MPKTFLIDLSFNLTQKSFFLDNALLTVLSHQGVLLHTGKLFEKKKEKIHLLAYNPLVSFYQTHCLFHKEEKTYSFKNSSNFLKDFMEENKHLKKTHFPFEGGLIGIFSYDYKNHLEERNLFKTFPSPSENIYLVLYQTIEVYNQTKQSCLIIRQQLKTNPIFDKKKKKMKSNYSFKKNQKTNYETLIRKIKKQIMKGNTYQVNISRKIMGQKKKSTQTICKNLFLKNPAPYEGILETPFGTIISTSPERFFIYSKNTLEVAPIKGTIQKKQNQSLDEKIKKQLLQSKKNLAELAMITDLMRNDLSKICLPHSVKVQAFPILSTYNNVHHLSAHIKGKTHQAMIDIFNALFPSGSVTGAPKIKTCQMIDHLEKESRGVYTGSLGYFSFSNECEFNVLIRTIHIIKSNFEYRVGGGITLLSNEQDELTETKHKEKIIKQVFFE